MSMTFDEKRELMLMYVAGQAEPLERSLAQEMLAAGDPEALGALAEAEAVLAHLALTMEPVQPSGGVHERLMQVVAAGESAGGAVRGGAAEPESIPGLAGRLRPANRSSWPWVIVGGAVAAMVAVVLTLAYNSTELRKQQDTIVSLENEVRTQRQYLLMLESDQATLASLRDTLGSPNLRVVQLAGAPAQPDAAGRLLWDAQRGRSYFYAHNLKPAGADKDYQLWYVTAAGEKVSMGTFDVGLDGHAAVEMDFKPVSGEVAVTAVTDEPAGGVEQPTGAFQMLGEFK